MIVTILFLIFFNNIRQTNTNMVLHVGDKMIIKIDLVPAFMNHTIQWTFLRVTTFSS